MSENEVDEVLEEILNDLNKDEVTWSETVQVGDWVDASSDGFYLSGPQYKTKDRLYQVREVDIRKDKEGKVYSRTVIVDGDYLDPKGDGNPERQWLGVGRVIIREGEIIWENSTQRSVKHLLENPHLEPKATEENWEEIRAMLYTPDMKRLEK